MAKSKIVKVFMPIDAEMATQPRGYSDWWYRWPDSIRFPVPVHFRGEEWETRHSTVTPAVVDTMGGLWLLAFDRKPMAAVTYARDPNGHQARIDGETVTFQLTRLPLILPPATVGLDDRMSLITLREAEVFMQVRYDSRSGTEVGVRRYRTGPWPTVNDLHELTWSKPSDRQLVLRDLVLENAEQRLYLVMTGSIPAYSNQCCAICQRRAGLAVQFTVTVPDVFFAQCHEPPPGRPEAEQRRDRKLPVGAFAIVHPECVGLTLDWE